MPFLVRVACLAGLCLSATARADDFHLIEDGLSIPRLYAYDVGALHGIALHELGHALVAAGLPLVGPEEDIADEFAVIELIALAQRGEEGHALLHNYVRTFIAQALYAERMDHVPSSFEPHSPFGKRAYNALILLFGAFPERYGALADEMNLSAYERTRAVADYRRKAAIWADLLKPYAPTGGAPGFEIIGEGEAIPPRYLHEAAPLWLAYSQNVLTPQMNASLRLPRTLVLRVGPCDTGGEAHYDDEAGTIQLCAGQLGDLERTLVSVRTGAKFKTWWRDTLAAGVRPDLVGAWRTADGGLLTLGEDGRFTGPFGETGLWGVEDGRLWRIETSWPEGASPKPSTAAIDQVLRIDGPDAITLGGAALKRVP